MSPYKLRQKRPSYLAGRAVPPRPCLSLHPWILPVHVHGGFPFTCHDPCHEPCRGHVSGTSGLGTNVDEMHIFTKCVSGTIVMVHVTDLGRRLEEA